jgi:hypothetical protein
MGLILVGYQKKLKRKKRGDKWVPDLEEPDETIHDGSVLLSSQASSIYVEGMAGDEMSGI